MVIQGHFGNAAQYGGRGCTGYTQTTCCAGIAQAQLFPQQYKSPPPAPPAFSAHVASALLPPATADHTPTGKGVIEGEGVTEGAGETEEVGEGAHVATTRTMRVAKVGEQPL